MAITLTGPQKFVGVSVTALTSVVVFSVLVFVSFPSVKPVQASVPKLDLSGIASSVSFSSVAVASPFPTFAPDSLNKITNGVMPASNGYVPTSPMQTYNSAAPSTPAVPQMPQMPGASGASPGAAGSSSNNLSVIGVLPPNVVILKKGTVTVTAKAGSDTSLGGVGEVTKEGAYVDGSFVSLKR